MGSKGSPPAAPDYIGAAREQGRQNLSAIRTSAALNRVNQRNPYGSTTYRNLGNDQWEQTTSLSPDQQRILDQSESNQIDLGRYANLRLGDVGKQGAFTLDGVPSQVTGVNQSNFQTTLAAPNVAQRDVDLSSLGTLPTDTTAERQKAEDAVYRSATRQLDPQWSQRENATRTRLINQGVTEGSEAWNNEIGNLSRERESAYGDARDRAIMAGGNESTRILSDALRARQQGVSEQFGSGQFANDAAAQEFQSELARVGYANDIRGQQFQQGVTNAGLQNSGRSTGISERLLQRQVPMNEFLQLYGGGGGGGMVGQVPGVPQAGQAQAGDYQGAVQAGYNAQLDQYNYQQQQQQQMMQTGIALASLFAMSDERLKTDIEQVGELPQGLGVYEYRYTADPRGERHTGVMAQEVERVHPDAVIETESGYKAVDYGKVLSEALRRRRAA